ncbi:MAG: phage head closure protein, partial [Eubacterium sp.]|nr:phage head closure protein [Eubacterium sp.]
MRGYKNFESDPHPGELRHKIEIGYTENTINENGYPAPTDVVVCRVWAAVTDAGNQHYRAADVMNTEAVINFTIRYREDIKPGMWVRFQGDKWNISTLGEYSFKRTYLGLKASLAKGGERMRQVQQALANIGIPVYAGIWRATSPNQNPPEQYCVYSTTTTEGSH